MKWRTKTEITDEQVLKLSEKLYIDTLLSRIVLNRGCNEEQARIILKDIHEAITNPYQLANAKEAADIITKYCEDETAVIWIFADYDCDGITSGYTMKKSIEEVAKCEVNLYYPERKEGYGLNMTFAENIIDFYGDNSNVLIITVDNGVAQVEQINKLVEHGIEVVVTDHHMSKKEVPNCLIVDPHNAHVEQDDTFKHLCGCGVAFKVAQLVQENFEVYNMMKYTPYVAIGTIADIMPMSTENIALIKYGLEIINSEECPEGIKAFKDLVNKDILNSHDIAWELAPRINACGRMGNIKLGAKLFFEADDYEDIVNEIELINNERKSYSDKAKKMIQNLNFDKDNVCVLNATDYPEGVIGPIAGQLVEKFKKPAIVVGGEGDKLVGSARTYNNIAIQQILSKEFEKGNLENFGGHDAAAGVTIKKDKFDSFKESINQQIGEIIKVITEDATEVEEELIIDELIEIEHLNEDTYKLINEIPYDKKVFPQPIFALTDVTIVQTKISSNNPNNICFKIKNNSKTIDIWAWGMAENYKKLGSPNKMHIAGYIERNFMSPKNFTLKVVDFIGA